MNKKFEGKKWKKANYSRICRTWFVMWMLYEKNAELCLAEQIWDKKLTESSFRNELFREYSNNPVRPTKKFQEFLELSK